MLLVVSLQRPAEDRIFSTNSCCSCSSQSSLLEHNTASSEESSHDRVRATDPIGRHLDRGSASKINVEIERGASGIVSTMA
jgi:hypothetical protein